MFAGQKNDLLREGAKKSSSLNGRAIKEKVIWTLFFNLPMSTAIKLEWG